MARSTTTLVIYRTTTTIHATADEATSIYQTTSPYPYNFSAPLKKILCNKIPCHHIDLKVQKDLREQYMVLILVLVYSWLSKPFCGSAHLKEVVFLWIMTNHSFVQQSSFGAHCLLNHSVPQPQKKTFEFCTCIISCSAAETE